MEEETIRLDNLSIGYPGKKVPHVVADRIFASLKAGELTCLLGANGVGKSTLLRTLSAFQPPLNGAVQMAGHDIRQFSREQLSTKISVVLTDRFEVAGMTVYELVALGRTPYTDFWGTMNQEDKRVVDRSLEMVGITDLARRNLQELSDGERQKAMIAKALAQETPVIYLDEPTAFLDFPSKVDVMQLLRRLCREMNKSILLSTHDVELALQIADKIWLMESSKELITGTPEDLALEGRLTHFLVRKGISFNEQTGLFDVDNEVTRTVCVMGDGNRVNMLRKALKRNGIGTEEKSKYVVHVTDEDFCLSHDGIIIVRVHTIEALLAALNKE